MTFDRVLVPLDGSPLAETALPAAMALLGEGPGATLILVRAAQAPTRMPWANAIEAQVDAVGEAKRYLSRIADGLRGHAREHAVTTSVWYGPAAQAIVDAAAMRGAQLIVMSTHGRSGLRRVVFGSVAESVLRTTTTPVLLVPASADQWPRGSAARFAHLKKEVVHA